jgi:hypothetical protein
MIPNPAAIASPFALLWPTFAMAGLVFIVWITLFVQRIGHIRRNPPGQGDLSTGEAARRYFQPVEMPANNLANLFEMPVLFFALVPLLLMFRQVTSAQLMLAWLFVLLRAAHSLIRVGRGGVRNRFRMYAASTAVLSAMWIGFFVDALGSSRLYAIHQDVLARL